jgi:hypothetical protein
MSSSGYRDQPPSKHERQGTRNRTLNLMRFHGVRENFFETVRSYLKWVDDEPHCRKTLTALAEKHPEWFY